MKRGVSPAFPAIPPPRIVWLKTSPVTMTAMDGIIVLDKPPGISSHDAVQKLRKRGLRARRLEEGFPEWKAAGLPVER